MCCCREKPSAARFAEASGLGWELPTCRFWHAAVSCVKDELCPLGEKLPLQELRPKYSGYSFPPNEQLCLTRLGSLAGSDTSIVQHSPPGKGGLGPPPPVQLFSMLLARMLFCFPSLEACRPSWSLGLLLRACFKPGICQDDQQEHSLTSPLKARLFTSSWLGRGVSVSRECHAGASLLSQIQSAAGV